MKAILDYFEYPISHGIRRFHGYNLCLHISSLYEEYLLRISLVLLFIVWLSFWLLSKSEMNISQFVSASFSRAGTIEFSVKAKRLTSWNSINRCCICTAPGQFKSWIHRIISVIYGKSSSSGRSLIMVAQFSQTLLLYPGSWLFWS